MDVSKQLWNWDGVVYLIETRCISWEIGVIQSCRICETEIYKKWWFPDRVSVSLFCCNIWSIFAISITSTSLSMVYGGWFYKNHDGYYYLLSIIIYINWIISHDILIYFQKAIHSYVRCKWKCIEFSHDILIYLQKATFLCPLPVKMYWIISLVTSWYTYLFLET